MPREVSFDVDEAVSLFKKHPSWRKVAKMLGVHPFSLQSKLSSLGYSVDVDSLYEKKWSDKASKMRRKHMTYKEIGLALGVSTSAIQREMVKKHGKGGRPDAD
jgi:hypothetical protein